MTIRRAAVPGLVGLAGCGGGNDNGGGEGGGASGGRKPSGSITVWSWTAALLLDVLERR